MACRDHSENRLRLDTKHAGDHSCGRQRIAGGIPVCILAWIEVEFLGLFVIVTISLVLTNKDQRAYRISLTSTPTKFVSENPADHSNISLY